MMKCFLSLFWITRKGTSPVHRMNLRNQSSKHFALELFIYVHVFIKERERWRFSSIVFTHKIYHLLYHWCLFFMISRIIAFYFDCLKLDSPMQIFMKQGDKLLYFARARTHTHKHTYTHKQIDTHVCESSPSPKEMPKQELILSIWRYDYQI